MFIWTLTKENHFLQREIICIFKNFPKAKMLHQLLSSLTKEEILTLTKDLKVEIFQPTLNTTFVYRLEQARIYE